MFEPERIAAAGAFDARRVLTETFGFDAFRPGQHEIVQDILGGDPVLAVMPTGAGKSLCYQLPAVLLGAEGGVTLVVSPLIALMKDQVDGLRSRGVPCAALTSAASPEEQREILRGIGAGQYQLVYVAPERFHSPRFLEALAEAEGRLALFAIDEAHCISEWGHDFRPAYRLLGDAIARLRPPRVVALTATATPEVRQDIERQLGLGGARKHVRGFARPNLCMSVERAGGSADKASRLVELVRTRAGGCALVYAATRKNAERHAARLASAGMRALAYHAGMQDDERRKAQDAFMEGSLDAIVATNAFGMGVDKADVRLVVHSDLPRSPEAYYQEAGRAGRDGAPADCVLLFNHGDVRLQEFLIEASFPDVEVLRETWRLLREQTLPAGEMGADALRYDLPGRPHTSVVRTTLRILARHGYLAEEGGQLWAVKPNELSGDFAPLDPESLARRAEVERGKLRSMVEYAYFTGCRHRYFLSYFGDAEADREPERCSACDSCRGAGQAAPLGEEEAFHIRALLALVAQLSGRFGRRKIARVAVAADDDERLLELPERGMLAGQSAEYAMDLLRALEGGGLLKVKRGEYPTLQITSRGRKVAAGELEAEGLSIALPDRRKPRRKRGAAADFAASADPPNPEVAERLRTLRTELARERGVPAYIIYSNRTLDAIAAAQPTSLPDLARVPGIGEAKLESFGEQILRAVSP